MNHSIATYSGRLVDIYNFHVHDVDISDIAHHLALRCRWSGATKIFYSIAEHAVRCTLHLRRHYNITDPNTLLKMLHHDDAEAYIPDFPRPYKNTCYFSPDRFDGRPIYQPVLSIESDILKAVHQRFGINRVPDDHWIAICDTDYAMWATEARDLMHRDQPWEDEGTPIPGLDLTSPWTSIEAETEFLNLHDTLTNLHMDYLAADPDWDKQHKCGETYRQEACSPKPQTPHPIPQP